MSTTELFTIAKSIWNHRGDIRQKYGVEFGVVPVQNLAMLLARYDRLTPATVSERNPDHPARKPLAKIQSNIDSIRKQCHALFELGELSGDHAQALSKLLNGLALAEGDIEDIQRDFGTIQSRYGRTYWLHSMDRDFYFEARANSGAGKPSHVYKRANVLHVLRETLIELGVPHDSLKDMMIDLLILSGRERKNPGKAQVKSLHDQANNPDEYIEKPFLRPNATPVWLLPEKP